MEISLYYSKIDPSLLKVILALCVSSIEIEELVRFLALKNLQGDHSNEQNSSGDIQKKLDVISNEIVIKHLTQTKCCNILLSEENEAPIVLKKESKTQLYTVAYDPLDGSSNIDCNAPIGTIYSITPNEKDETLLGGNQIVVAGYVLYGPSTELVLSVNNTVDRFVLSANKKYLHVGTIRLNGKKKIYSINEANSNSWNRDMKNYIDGYKANGTKYTARYIGSMLGDVHRTLLYGGMFCYPADKKNPNGKLRVLYEAFPMAKIVEDAGGSAILGNNSKQRILDIVPKDIHQRTPILLGSKEEINKYSIISKL